MKVIMTIPEVNGSYFAIWLQKKPPKDDIYQVTPVISFGEANLRSLCICSSFILITVQEKQSEIL